jgi:hypothetical protein
MGQLVKLTSNKGTNNPKSSDIRCSFVISDSLYGDDSAWKRAKALRRFRDIAAETVSKCPAILFLRG